MESPSFIQNIDGLNIQKYIQQAERKKEYNRTYYQNRVKPKRENTRQELDAFRLRCEQLEISLVHLQNNQIDEENLQRIIEENQQLHEQIIKLTQENESFKQLLELSRNKNYSLLKRSIDILPPITHPSIL
jgi:hypothetical protein